MKRQKKQSTPKLQLGHREVVRLLVGPGGQHNQALLDREAANLLRLMGFSNHNQALLDGSSNHNQALL